jgi:predicted ribosome quality control (RQC) complex YloA/Tae2 family protein
MKHFIIKNLALFLDKYKFIHNIKRVTNSTILIEFENNNIFYFDMTKGNSWVYKKTTKDNNFKNFIAPFDILLQKNFTNCVIHKIYLRNNDKILNIKIQSKSSYKKQIFILQLEFTGKNTNIIILDENDIVLEALRHIDQWSSIRVVKTGQKLIELEKPTFEFEKKDIKNIEKFLFDIYNTKQNQKLKVVKNQKIQQINKHIAKIQNILNSLQDIKTLKQNSINFNKEATQIISDLYKVKGFQKQKNLKLANSLFKDSKKAKAKIKNQYIEQHNLTLKLNFFKKLVHIVTNCKTTEEIEFYYPKKDKNQTKTKKQNPYQSFFIDGYKIMLGRDERENIYLLKNAKASDFWFHLQKEVSSHVIVLNRKKSLPLNIIEEASKLCARFSKNSGGTFVVDYTQRRNVKIQNKANVLYNPYTSIVVKI